MPLEMLNLLLILSEKTKWETVTKNIVDYGINADFIFCNQGVSSIIGHIASQNIDGVFYCFDEEEKSDLHLNILLEIRRLNPEIVIVILANENNDRVQRIALECEAEWCLTCSSDIGMLILLLQRVEKRVKTLKSRKEKRIHSILIDYIKDERKVSYQDKMDLFQNYQKAPYYQTFIVRILPPYRKRTLIENDNLVILKGRESLNKYLAGFNSNIYEYGHDLLVVAAGEISELLQIQESLESFLDEMKRFSQAIFPVAAWVYMGIIVKSIQNVPLSYKSAHEIRNNRLLLPGSGILVAKERTVALEPQEDSHIQVFDVRKSLSNALATFDEQLIYKSLNQLKSNLTSSVEINGKEIFSIYRTLLSSLVHELEWKEMDLSEKDIDYDYLVEEFEYFWNLDDVFKTLEGIYITVLNELKSREEENEPTSIVLAKRYIRMYFNMPLSLSELSIYIGMNENYFSEYFKKKRESVSKNIRQI